MRAGEMRWPDVRHYEHVSRVRPSFKINGDASAHRRLKVRSYSRVHIIIIDKTDAGLNGLCIRDITLICDVINRYNNY